MQTIDESHVVTPLVTQHTREHYDCIKAIELDPSWKLAFNQLLKFEGPYICKSECKSVESLPVDLIQDHNKSRDEHVVDVREHGDDEGVLSQQHVCGSVLAVDLHHTSNECIIILTKIQYKKY